MCSVGCRLDSPGSMSLQKLSGWRELSFYVGIQTLRKKHEPLNNCENREARVWFRTVPRAWKHRKENNQNHYTKSFLLRTLLSSLMFGVMVPYLSCSDPVVMLTLKVVSMKEQNWSLYDDGKANPKGVCQKSSIGIFLKPTDGYGTFTPYQL